MISSTACSVSDRSPSGLHYSRSVSYKVQLCAFVTKRNWDDFCIPSIVGSDPWYHDMIAFGAVAFSCRTLGFGFILSRRTKDHSQAKSNCKDVNDLSESKEKIQQINCVLTL